MDIVCGENELRVLHDAVYQCDIFFVTSMLQFLLGFSDEVKKVGNEWCCTVLGAYKVVPVQHDEIMPSLRIYIHSQI